MSFLLLFSGGSGRRRAVALPADEVSEVLATLATEDRADVQEQARALLAPLDFGLSDENLLRQVLDQWGESPVADTIRAMADAVDESALLRLATPLAEAGRDLAAGVQLESEADPALLRDVLLIVLMAIVAMGWATTAVLAVNATGDRLYAIPPLAVLAKELYELVRDHR